MTGSENVSRINPPGVRSTVKLSSLGGRSGSGVYSEACRALVDGMAKLAWPEVS